MKIKIQVPTLIVDGPISRTEELTSLELFYDTDKDYGIVDCFYGETEFKINRDNLISALKKLKAYGSD